MWDRKQAVRCGRAHVNKIIAFPDAANGNRARNQGNPPVSCPKCCSGF